MENDLTPLAGRLRSGELDLHEYLDELELIVSAFEPTIQALLPEPDRFGRLHRAADRLLAAHPDVTLRPPLFGVPVGIIHSSEGGSPIRAWVPIEGLETQPLFAEFLKQRRTAHGEDREACGLELSRTGIGNYDAMLHPLVPYALRGFIWHQGEQDGSSGDNYRLMLHALK